MWFNIRLLDGNINMYHDKLYKIATLPPRTRQTLVSPCSAFKIFSFQSCTQSIYHRSARLTLDCNQKMYDEDAAILVELLPRDVMTYASHVVLNAINVSTFLSLDWSHLMLY